jgi:hypothetical protein
VRGQLHDPVAVPPGKRRRLGGPQNQSGHGGEERNLCSYCNSNPGRPARSLYSLAFAGVKWLGHEADHSPPSTADIKNAWSYTSTPPCLHGMVLG